MWHVVRAMSNLGFVGVVLALIVGFFGIAFGSQSVALCCGVGGLLCLLLFLLGTMSEYVDWSALRRR